MKQSSPAESSHPSEPPFAVPGKWRWHLQTLLRLRERLRRQTRAHLHDAESLQHSDSDFGARASEESEFENLLAEVKSGENLLGEVEAALERMRDGSYGVCVATQRTISEARLRALPWTRFSVEAAAQRDAQAAPGAQA